MEREFHLGNNKRVLMVQTVFLLVIILPEAQQSKQILRCGEINGLLKCARPAFLDMWL